MTSADISTARYSHLDMSPYPLLACHDLIISHYPSLIFAVSLSSISYALHISIAVSTLTILTKKVFIDMKDRRIITYPRFVLTLLLMATAHLSDRYFSDPALHNRVEDILTLGIAILAQSFLISLQSGFMTKVTHGCGWVFCCALPQALL
ncbi:hypothetical protein BDV98DRAFT_425474 [Pterulicium gracile]|uniref:Uncharacterized protein n=1 Tax=Pterulicium gracile TaxID=1884261 RepID=A0A5C3QNJ9_9AGAR|nr:hypothetical protein BDV98DRAFT_425474 [Pterula gracilis]